MYGHLDLPRSSLAEVRTFTATSPGNGTGWVAWTKRPGATMVYMLCIGGGGGGGNGVVGAASTAGGGGGGGSGAQTSLLVPALLLPDVLFVCAGTGGGPAVNGQISRVALQALTGAPAANDVVITANGGSSGSNASGGSAGGGGGSASVTSVASMVLAGAGVFFPLAGQGGTNGGSNNAGTNLTIPTTGLRVTGGTGGGGLPAGGNAGNNAGSFAIGGSAVMPQQSGGTGGPDATTPPRWGSNGFAALPVNSFFYGGTGGGSTHGSATGAGLVGANGGNGGYGSGGGGGGGALTGSSQGLGGFGGDGLVVIAQW